MPEPPSEQPPDPREIRPLGLSREELDRIARQVVQVPGTGGRPGSRRHTLRTKVISPGGPAAA